MAEAQSLTGSQTQNVTVSNPTGGPTANFSFTCTNLACTFDATVSTFPSTGKSAAWVFGDGTTGTGPKPSPTYAAAGTYNVRLTVTDQLNRTDDTTRAVAVTSGGGNGPTARFTFTCTGRTCTFDGSTTTAPNGLASLDWNFGDGATAIRVRRPVHTYATGGTFTVTLTARDNLGLTNSTSSPVTVP